MKPAGQHAIELELLDGNLQERRVRSAIVYIPASFSRLRPVSVLALHGAGSNAEHMMQFCGLNEIADENGVAIVYPNGSGRTPDAGTWNGGPQCGYAGRKQIDDVGFVRELLSELRHHWLPTNTQFFAAGMSNGGLMCYRLAEEMAEEFRAIACVAGAMGSPIATAKKPVSILHLHGTDDEFVPFEGGIGRRSLTKTPFVSVPASIAAWVQFNGCHPVPTVDIIPNSETSEDQETTIERTRYVNGRQASCVHLYKVFEGGHTWPGRPSDMRFLGKTTLNLDANQVLWDFFQARLQ